LQLLVQKWYLVKIHFLGKGTTLKRPANPPVPALRIELQSACPLYRQVYNQLRQAILDQKLSAGARLPSTRALACMLGVSRNTILNAYEALVADALLAARKGSGTHVSTPSDKIQSLATPMQRSFDLRTALLEARFPTISACLRDPDGNPLYLHR
jgi:DNA-binding transcriptional regulator YhcF (GntR family)